MKNKYTHFRSGAVRDTQNGKENYVECFSFTAWRRYGQYMLSKEGKYPPDNWRKGIDIKSYEKSLLRHIQKYFANKYEQGEFEPQEDHLSACMFNLMGIIHEEEMAKKKRK